MWDYRDAIKAYIRLERDILNRLDVDSINDAMNLLEDTFEKENTIYIFGNGGSAATASHFQNDFNKGISEHTSKKFRFQCLNDNVATILAIANDIAYEEIFRFQLAGRLRQDDVVIAISGSGNSKNVLNAAEYARENKAKVIGITGYDGGRLKGLSDVWLNAPVNSMQITEDVHMILNHLMMSIFYSTLAGIDHLAK